MANAPVPAALPELAPGSGPGRGPRSRARARLWVVALGRGVAVLGLAFLALGLLGFHHAPGPEPYSARPCLSELEHAPPAPLTSCEQVVAAYRTNQRVFSGVGGFGVALFLFGLALPQLLSHLLVRAPAGLGR